MKVVIVPTYNEAEKLPKIVSAILEHVPDTHILIVDDNSPDGTGEIAQKLSEERPEQIFCLHRPNKEGLGRAYLNAFHEVLQRGYQKIVQMDADFSHPPALLPSLFEKLDDYDFVLASRYIPGGGINNWGVFRRWVSKLGNLYARWILNIPITDLTGGYKAYNRQVLEYLLQCSIESLGYNFQIETTAFALLAKFSYIELPFYFEERTKGESKMNLGIIWEALTKTFLLRKRLKDRGVLMEIHKR